MFETLLQVMSNDGFEVIICTATQTSFNGVNNTGGEANLKKCILLCLIQTSVTLAIIKARKVTILKDYVLKDILKEVDVEDYDSTISEEVAELNDFRKKIGISILVKHTFSSISSNKISWKYISNFRLGYKKSI